LLLAGDDADQNTRLPFTFDRDLALIEFDLAADPML
jgi:hypothetical protein